MPRGAAACTVKRAYFISQTTSSAATWFACAASRASVAFAKLPVVTDIAASTNMARAQPSSRMVIPFTLPFIISKLLFLRPPADTVPPGSAPISLAASPLYWPAAIPDTKKAQSEHTPGSIVCVKFMIALRAGFVKKNEELSLHSIFAFISFVCPRPKRPETVRSRGVSFMIITYTRQPRAFLLIQASFDTAPFAKN